MTMRKMYLACLAAAALMCLTSVALGDVKIKTRTSMAGQSFEGTTYIKKARKRSEQDMGPLRTANIEQCDLRRNVQLNDAARTYLVTPFDEGGASAGTGGAAAAQPRPSAAPAQRGGVVTYTSKLTDTGERKQMFGMTARRIKSEMTIDSSPDACSKQKMRMETDGWYVDFSADFSCPVERQAMVAPPPTASGGCRDRVQFKTLGTAKLGYPLETTMTMYDEAGRATMTMKTETLELSQAPLDAALFEVPAGYTEVASAQELYAGGMGAAAMAAAAAAAGAGEDDNDDANAATTGSGTTPMTPPANTGAASVGAVGPKKPGVLRVGVVPARAQMSGGAANAGEAVRNTFVQMLTGPNVEAVALDAQAPAQAEAECAQKECDFILYADVTQKKGGGGGMFGKTLGGIAGAAAGHIPGTSAGAAATRTVAAGAHATASVAGTLKARDEITLEYRLTPAGVAEPLAADKLKAKARSDGDDVLTPLVQQAASAAVAAATRR